MTIENGGFEFGTFRNFRTIGNTSIETADFGSGPSEGTFQALLTNGVSDSGGSVVTSDIEEFLDLAPGLLDGLGNGDVTEGSAIKQTFTADAGDILTFDFNFLTNEDATSLFNDFAFFTVNPFTLELADTTDPTSLDDPLGSANFSAATSFETVSVAISAPGTYTLGFGVVDAGDSIVESGLLLDNIQLTSTGIGTEPISIEGSLVVRSEVDKLISIQAR